jgi:hypothetical protein
MTEKQERHKQMPKITILPCLRALLAASSPPHPVCQGSEWPVPALYKTATDIFEMLFF